MIASFISLNSESSILMIGITPDDLPNITGDILAPTIDITAACEHMQVPLPTIVQIIFGMDEAAINATIAVAFKATVEQFGGNVDEDTESSVFEVNAEGEIRVTENSQAIERAAADGIKYVQTKGGQLN